MIVVNEACLAKMVRPWILLPLITGEDGDRRLDTDALRDRAVRLMGWPVVESRTWSGLGDGPSIEVYEGTVLVEYTNERAIVYDGVIDEGFGPFWNPRDFEPCTSLADALALGVRDGWGAHLNLGGDPRAHVGARETFKGRTVRLRDLLPLIGKPSVSRESDVALILTCAALLASEAR